MNPNTVASTYTVDFPGVEEVTASPDEIAFIKKTWHPYKHGADFQGPADFRSIILAKIEKGWDVKAFYLRSMNTIEKKLVIPFCIYYIVVAIIGIVLSRYDCQADYCYNVNQYLWVLYGCVGIGNYVVLYVHGCSMYTPSSEFMKYFVLTFGNFSQVYFTLNNSIAVPIVGVIVSLVYTSKTSYLTPVLLVTAAINLLACAYVFYIKSKINEDAFSP